MKELQLAASMLDHIVNGGMNFQDAIKAVFPPNSLDKHYQGATCAFVGCELRHFNLIKEVCKNVPNLTSEEVLYLYLAVANNAFLKKFENEEMIATIKEKFGDKYTPEIDEIFANTGDLMQLCKEYEVDSVDYISIRFNTPRWLVKMWQKHYGKALTFKILRKNNRQQIQTVRVNTNKVSTADFMAAHPGEFSLSNVEDVLIYNGKGQVRKTPYFRNFEIFHERLPVKVIVDKVFDIPMGEALLISAENDSIVKELYLKANTNVGVHVAVPDISKRPELLKLERTEKPINMSFFSAPSYLDMNATVNRKQDLAIVYPESSSFDLIRQYPDYLLRFEHERIDQCLAKQKEALEGADAFLLEGSKLVYMVNTLNKKETRGSVLNFINEHPNYELLEEKQFLSFDDYDTALYYAILLKKEISENTSND